MSPQSLIEFQTRQTLTRHQLASVLGVPINTLTHWIKGTRSPSGSADQLFNVLCTLEALAPAVLAGLIPAAVPPAKRGRKPAGARSPEPAGAPEGTDSGDA